MRLRWASLAVAVFAGMVLSGTAWAQADTFHVRATLDFTGADLTCPEEHVIFDGVGTELIAAVTTPTGVRASAFVFNLTGITAVGKTSGTVYRVVGVTATGGTDSVGVSRATTYRFVQTWLLVPVGRGETLSFHEVDQVTWDANGNLVSFVFNLGECD
jgi:hypothetical protein